MRNILPRSLAALALMGMATVANAVTPQSIQLGSNNNSLLQKYVQLLQSLVDFVGGPIALVITAAAIVAGAAVWFLEPKQAIVAVILKIIGGGVILLNIASIIAFLIVN